MDPQAIFCHNSASPARDVHQHLVERSRDLGQVQGDEIRVKTQGASV
jgi:hypothetical protein